MRSVWPLPVKHNTDSQPDLLYQASNPTTEEFKQYVSKRSPQAPH